jgi:hypothetical protein
VLINPARNPSIFRRRFPIRLWYPSQHLLRQNPPPRSQLGFRRRFPRAVEREWADQQGPDVGARIGGCPDGEGLPHPQTRIGLSATCAPALTIALRSIRASDRAFGTEFLRDFYHQILGPRRHLAKLATVFADTRIFGSTSTRILSGKPPRAIWSAAMLLHLYRA